MPFALNVPATFSVFVRVTRTGTALASKEAAKRSLHAMMTIKSNKVASQPNSPPSHLLVSSPMLYTKSVNRQYEPDAACYDNSEATYTIHQRH